MAYLTSWEFVSELLWLHTMPPFRGHTPCRQRAHLCWTLILLSLYEWPLWFNSAMMSMVKV